MLAVAIIVVALSLVVVINQFVSDARQPNSDTAVGLDCNNSSISDYQKGQCVLTDLATPYFFFGLIGIAALVIGAKVLLQ